MLLYRHLHIAAFPQSKSTVLLHRTLQENPMLGRYVRSLNLTFGDYLWGKNHVIEVTDSVLLVEYIAACSATARGLYIYSGGSRTPPGALPTVVPKILAKLPFLENFEMRGYCTYSICTPAVFASMTQANRLRCVLLSDWDSPRAEAGEEFIGPSVSFQF